MVGGSGAKGPSFVRARIGYPLYFLEASLDRVTQSYIDLCLAPPGASSAPKPDSSRSRLDITAHAPRE